MILVDSGPWYDSIVPTAKHHAIVVDWFQRHSLPVVTTDYIVDETLTLLRARGERERAIALGRRFFDLGGVAIIHVSQEDVRRGWFVFQQFADHDWSFTDCVSKVVMERLHIKQAFSFDRHFREFGNITVFP